MFASATRLKRSKKFICKDVDGLARVAAGRRAVRGAKADAVVRRSAARIGAMTACLVRAAAWRLLLVVEISPLARRLRCAAAAEIFAENYV